MTQKKPSSTDSGTTTSQSQKSSRKFFALTVEEWTETTNKLTKTEIQILYFLRAADPYSNGISAKSRDLAARFNTTQRSINRAIAHLKEKNLVEAEPTEWELKLKVQCPGLDTNVQVETPVSSPDLDTNVQAQTPTSRPGHQCPDLDTNVQTETLKSTTETLMSSFDSETPLQSGFRDSKNIKNIKNIHTSLERTEEKTELKCQEQEAIPNSRDEQAIAPDSSRKLASSSGLSSPSPAPFISAYQKFEQSAHPALVYSEDVPWLLPPSGRAFTKFKPEFLDWGAREFLEEFGKKDFYKARADFLAHLKNSPDKIEAKWEQYCSQVTHKAVTTAARVKAGIQVEDEEKQFLLENRSAIARPETLKIDPKVMAAAIPENAEMPNPYEEFAGDADNFWKNLSFRKSMPLSLPEDSETDKERWQRWLHSGDPSIISLAVKQLKRAGYSVLYDGDCAYGFAKGSES